VSPITKAAAGGTLAL